MTVLGHIKNCLLSNPSRPEASQIFAALCDRILDYDENVRRHVVEVVCDVARSDLDSVPVDTAKLVAERLRDKSLVVKKYTLDKLADIYSQYCLRSSGGSSLNETMKNLMPGCVLICLSSLVYSFTSDAIEAILSGPLFPSEFAVQDLVNQRVKIFSGLDKVEVKAMEKILEQKQCIPVTMEVKSQRLNVIIKPKLTHGPKHVLCSDRLPLLMLAPFVGLACDEADVLRHTLL
ncbi:hypothetical protein Droror1_Dr00019381 [Drosera rotundifolia]